LKRAETTKRKGCELPTVEAEEEPTSRNQIFSIGLQSNFNYFAPGTEIFLPIFHSQENNHLISKRLHCNPEKKVFIDSTSM
jgi:hypothetical protein